jgi:hypothetical protein
VPRPDRALQAANCCEFVVALPKNNDGKALKTVLRERV